MGAGIVGNTDVVALRKESVDRNLDHSVTLVPHEQVALRKESVDRNYPLGPPSFLYGASLSARRAWIEIQDGARHNTDLHVALRKESVDRNSRWSPT